MDLTNLENALNNSDFKEQVYRSLEGIYQISNVLNQLDLLKNFSEHDLEIVQKIESIKSALAGYEISEQELKAQINALVGSLGSKKQELEATIKQELEATIKQELEATIKQELEATIKQRLEATIKQELEALKASNEVSNPRIKGALKFLGYCVYGKQLSFTNRSAVFYELFEFCDITLQANKSYIVQFSMPFELDTDGYYTDSMGEMVLCLKANSKVWPIVNSFYQTKTAALIANKNIGFYRTTCVFETPSEQADYKIAVFARKHKQLWVNVNYTSNINGFETSLLNDASFDGATTQSIPTKYHNDIIFYKNSQALVYEILK